MTSCFAFSRVSLEPGVVKYAWYVIFISVQESGFSPGISTLAVLPYFRSSHSQCCHSVSYLDSRTWSLKCFLLLCF
ncbi:hypothetical protein GN956_G7614 [Arapaima gigas]